MSSPVTSVQELRRRWKPHKDRLRALQSDHPTNVRFHRACSWLDQAEQVAAAGQLDQLLLHQWIAFNALYGQWDPQAMEPVGDRRSWQVFIERIVRLDQSQHVSAALQLQRTAVLAILEDAYLNRHFWQQPDAKRVGQVRGRKQQAMTWYFEKRWLQISEQVLERVYLLRCQLTHGAATHGSKLNRTALGHCTTMLGAMVPAMLMAWIDYGSDKDWGPMCYPPLDVTVT